MVFSPLEQFLITNFVSIEVGGLIFAFTSSSLFMGLAVFFFIAFLRQSPTFFVVPSYVQSIAELSFLFIRDLLKEQVGFEGRRYFPIIFTLFVFICSQNLIGMIPFSFTTTSHTVVTFALSVTMVWGATFIGFQIHGIRFFEFLLPPGAPLSLAPLLVMLEFVSYCFRALSLGVRLFANMMAGHTLVNILAGFGWAFACLGNIASIVGLIPLGVVFGLIGLELGVAVLQAYVFTILTCIYLNDAIALH
jgi:ATP synthase subunit 6